MDDYRAAYDILDREALIVKGSPGVALIAKEGRQIPGMVGMRGGRGVIVVSGSCKVLAAISILVDVQGIKIAGAGLRYIGKAEDFRFHQDAAVGRLVKLDQAAEPRGLAAAPDPCHGLGVVLGEQIYKSKTGCDILHKVLTAAVRCFCPDGCLCFLYSICGKREYVLGCSKAAWQMDRFKPIKYCATFS